MKWQNLFNSQTLTKGYRLSQNNRATISNRPDADHFSGTVLDGFRYDVSVSINRDYYHMSCDCANARAGRYCQHMAALLYESEKKEEPKVIKPAELQKPIITEHMFDGYHFDLYPLVKPLKMTQLNLAKAKEFIDQGKIVLQHIGITYDYYEKKTQVLFADALIYQGDYQYRLQLQLTKERILNLGCDSCRHTYTYYYNYWKDLCAHEIALLMLVRDYILENDPGDATDLNGAMLINKFSQIRSLNQLEQFGAVKENILLEPRLTEKYGNLELSFKIGINKMYILKNMTEFVNKYNQKGVLELGKGNSLNFKVDDFTAESRQFYDFIEKRVAEANTFVSRYSSDIHLGHVDFSVKSKLALEGLVLDEFYDLMYAKSVNCDQKDGYKTLSRPIRFFNQRYHLDLTLDPVIDPRNSQFLGLKLHGDMPELISGGRYHYFMEKNTISRIDHEDYQSIEPLISSADSTGEIDMDIGKNNLSQFYYRILPLLRDNPLIHLTENIDSYVDQLPEEVTFRFYLDVNYSQLICRAEAVYANAAYPLNYQPGFSQKKDFSRDRKEEMYAFAAMKEIFPFYEEEQGYFYNEKNGDSVFELLNYQINTLMNLGEVQVSDAFKRLRLRKNFGIRVGLSVNSGILDFELLDNDLSEDDLLKLLNSYQMKKKYHVLNNGDLISLENNESLEVLMETLESSGTSLKEFVKGKIHLPLYRALYLNKMLEDHDNIALERDASIRQIVRTFNSVKESDYAVPDNLKGVLRNYQEYGYKWLRMLIDSNFGGILADDMGLGKTIQFISVIQGLKDEGKLSAPVLVTCPASVVYNWKEEFERFSRGIHVEIVAGTQAERREILKLREADVYITSYDLLKRDIDVYEEKHFFIHVLDEAQFIKSIKAANTKAVKIIQSEHRFALTGTPIENRLSELWSIFDFLMPGFLYTYEDFRNNYEKAIMKYNDEAITERLKQMVRPFILRRLKEDVLKDLPEKLEEIRYVRFDKEQQQIYDAQMAKTKRIIHDLDDSKGQSKIIVLAELTKLRQICCDPSLLVENFAGESAKREACIELIESAMEGGHRILLFSQFVTMLELLEKDLQEHGISYYKLTGTTSKRDRNILMHDFNDGDTPVFLVSLKAGGTGLNLTGADIVIHYDPWWNFAAQNQATDRAHRIGQTRKVSVFKLIAKDSIEEKIVQLQDTKKDLSDAILSGEAQSITSMSKDELLELLG